MYMSEWGRVHAVVGVVVGVGGCVRGNRCIEYVTFHNYICD